MSAFDRDLRDRLADRILGAQADLRGIALEEPDVRAEAEALELAAAALHLAFRPRGRMPAGLRQTIERKAASLSASTEEGDE